MTLKIGIWEQLSHNLEAHKSQLEDRIFSAISICMTHWLWLITYESTQGPYIFHISNGYDSLVMSQLEDRIFSGFLNGSCRGPYILADRIFFVKGPYIFSEKTVYFQILRTVYFRGPYILRQRTVYFSQKDRIFSVLGPYIFSQDRIFYLWPERPITLQSNK